MVPVSNTRKLALVAVASAAALGLAACSSSSSGGTSSAAPASSTAPVASTPASSTPAASTPASSAPATTGTIKKGLVVYYIPKDTNNPYEVIADQGGAAALKELGGKVVVSSGTADTAAAQIPSIQAAIQAHADAIVIAGNDPKALVPGTRPGPGGWHQGGFLRLRRDLPQPLVHQPGGHQVHRDFRGRPPCQADQQQGEIAILSAAATATNQNAWIKYMKEQLHKYPNMKLVATVYGNDDPATSLTALQGLLTAYPNLRGHHLADHGRHLHRGAVPATAPGAQGQGDAHRSGSSVADEAVRPGRHGEGLRAVEPERPRLPRRLRSCGAGLRHVTARDRRHVQRRQARTATPSLPHGRHRTFGGPRPAHRVRRVERRRSSTSDHQPRRPGARAGPAPTGPAGTRWNTTKGGPMRRVCFRLQVRPDLARGVPRSATQHVWPDMLAALRDAGWHNYSLFLATTAARSATSSVDDFAAAQAAMAASRVNARWQAEMADFFVGLDGRPPDEGIASARPRSSISTDQARPSSPKRPTEEAGP